MKNKILETINANINKSMQKDLKKLGFSRSQCDFIPMIIPHLHVEFRNGYAMNVYEDVGETIEISITKNGKNIEEDNDYIIEFLDAILKEHTYDNQNHCFYSKGCYCRLSIEHFIIVFKYFKSIK